jgi:hypothetical protein
VAALENKPESLLDTKKISLKDLIIFELLLEVDCLEYELGSSFKPLCNFLSQEPIDLFSELEPSELQEVLKIWQDAFEWSYYDEMLAGIQLNISKKSSKSNSQHLPSFQALFCIDERECSLRAHIEGIDNQVSKLLVVLVFLV